MIGTLDAWKASRKQPETPDRNDNPERRCRHDGPRDPDHKGVKEMTQTREIRRFLLVVVLIAAAVLLSLIALPSRADAA